MSAGRSRAAVIALAWCALAAGAAAAAASALAAHPKKGAHFSGSFAFTGVNGFKAPLAFTVSKNGKSLTGFSYSTLGCFGAGRFKRGVDYSTKQEAIINVGTIKISSSGHFSAAGVVFKYTCRFGYTTTTTTTVSGSFASAKAASGSVTFSQKLSLGGSCHGSPLRFKAKA